MNISSNGKTLTVATRELSRRWTETKEAWQDSKSQEFEQRFLAELISSVDRAAPLFDQLQKILAKAREDCE